jgi:hypothetical protein
MAPAPKVELYAAIRRDARAGMSARAIERKYRVGRRTIIKALASAWPEPRKKPPRRASKLDPFKPAIDEMLRADLDAPRKQRHTISGSTAGNVNRLKALKRQMYGRASLELLRKRVIHHPA